jgi:hypothetical protein
MCLLLLLELLQAAAAEFAKLKKPTTMSEDMDEEQQQAGGSEENEWEDEDEDDQPSYEFRFECAKMLLELDDTTETAIQVGRVSSPRLKYKARLRCQLPEALKGMAAAGSRMAQLTSLVEDSSCGACVSSRC